MTRVLECEYVLYANRTVEGEKMEKDSKSQTHTGKALMQDDKTVTQNFIPISQPSLGEREIEYVLSAVKSGWISSKGQYIDAFEKQFADFVGIKYALAVSNGTNALHLALASCGIKAGDEVIIPDLTFIATENAVRYTGADVVFVDIDKDTLCISPVSIERAITGKTKAIIPVHLYGHPANMREIMRIAKIHSLVVIEDAAEALGAEAYRQRVGSIGKCGVFSFYGNKIITTGEGGMLTTNDHITFEKARYLRDHAMDQHKRYWHTMVGFNYRMTNLQAAVGLAQMERIDKNHICSGIPNCICSCNKRQIWNNHLVSSLNTTAG